MDDAPDEPFKIVVKHLEPIDFKLWLDIKQAQLDRTTKRGTPKRKPLDVESARLR